MVLHERSEPERDSPTLFARVLPELRWRWYVSILVPPKQSLHVLWYAVGARGVWFLFWHDFDRLCAFYSASDHSRLHSGGARDDRHVGRSHPRDCRVRAALRCTVLLCWVILSYYILQPNELTANQAGEGNDAKD